MEIKEKVNVSDDISFDQQYLVSRLNFMKNELSEREKEPSKKNEGISSEESCFDMNVFDDKLKSNMHLFFNKSRETTLNSRSIV